jgi:hypothetical protein
MSQSDARVNPRAPKYELDSLTEYSAQAIVGEMRRVAALHPNGTLSVRSFSRYQPKVSYQTILQRYGTWKKALNAAGLSHLNVQRYAGSRYTDEQCLENLASVWTHYGRQPRFREMKKPPSAVGTSAYTTRWRTWRAALGAFVEWANREDTNDIQDHAQIDEISRRVVRTEADCRDVRPGLRFKIFMRDRFRCMSCGKSPATHLNVELHADHIKSVYDGGKTVYENLQTLCQDCNLGKGRTSLLP